MRHILLAQPEGRVRYRLQLIAVMAAAASAAHAQPESPGSLDLHLICQGLRTQTEQEQTSVQISGDGRSASGSALTDHVVRIPGRIDVSVSGNVVKVNPRSILKGSIWSAPRDGWYELTDVIIDQDQIAGKIRLTPLQKPSVRIDRHTGQIHMSGLAMRYEGSCERSAEPMSAQKF
jgi:hypothetical protein